MRICRDLQISVQDLRRRASASAAPALPSFASTASSRVSETSDGLRYLPWQRCKIVTAEAWSVSALRLWRVVVGSRHTSPNPLPPSSGARADHLQADTDSQRDAPAPRKKLVESFRSNRRAWCFKPHRRAIPICDRTAEVRDRDKRARYFFRQRSFCAWCARLHRSVDETEMECSGRCSCRCPVLDDLGVEKTRVGSGNARLVINRLTPPAPPHTSNCGIERQHD